MLQFLKNIVNITPYCNHHDNNVKGEWDAGLDALDAPR